MNNNVTSAETEVDSSTTAELIPSAQMPQNPVLVAGFLLVILSFRWL